MARIYDVTKTLSPAIKVWPGDQPLTVTYTGLRSRGDSCNLSAISATCHLGTHADAPWHMRDSGVTMADMPLSHYLGRCRVVHVPVHRGPIHFADLGTRPLEGGERLLLRTEISGIPEGQWPSEAPFLSVELVHRLADLHYTLIGVDFPSVDQAESKDFPAHNALLDRGMANLENLALSGVPDGDYELIALPLKLAGARVDVVGAVKKILSSKAVSTRHGTVVTKRSIILADATSSIFVTFWETDTQLLEEWEEGHSILTFTNLQVRHFNGQAGVTYDFKSEVFHCHDEHNEKISSVISWVKENPELHTKEKYDKANITEWFFIKTAKHLVDNSLSSYGNILCLVSQIALKDNTGSLENIAVFGEAIAPFGDYTDNTELAWKYRWQRMHVQFHAFQRRLYILSIQPITEYESYLAIDPK
ncbi:kynurenine formamidase [Pelomyxa schiedti]|nr:kynurenine formamidase [Pelomyxa schiedti]